jgi:hypothetical protein
VVSVKQMHLTKGDSATSTPGGVCTALLGAELAAVLSLLQGLHLWQNRDRTSLRWVMPWVITPNIGLGKGLDTGMTVGFWVELLHGYNDVLC